MDPLAQDAHRRVAGAILDLRPPFPKELKAAYDVFTLLLPELLLRGSTDFGEDADTICEELARPDIGKCFGRWVCVGEFERIVSTVMHFGSNDVDVQTIWAPCSPAIDEPVRDLIKHVRLGVMALGTTGTTDQQAVVKGIAVAASKRKVVDPSRLRLRVREGRPRSPAIDGLCELVLREALFPRGRPRAGALREVRKLAPRWKVKSLQKRYESLRKNEVPIAKRDVDPEGLPVDLAGKTAVRAEAHALVLHAVVLDLGMLCVGLHREGQEVAEVEASGPRNRAVACAACPRGAPPPSEHLAA